jgi:hypothetical protein
MPYVPPVKPVTISPRAIARQLLEAAAPRAAEVLAETLESKNEVLRLDAATRVLDRVEGKPRQSVTIEEDPEAADRKRFGDEVKALVGHVEQTTPDLTLPVLGWLRALSEGRNAEVPAGLVAPPAGHLARALYDHCIAQSGFAPVALPEPEIP